MFVSKCIVLFFALTAILVATVQGDDFVNRAAEREGQIANARSRYKQLSGQDPTLDAVIRSLSIKEASGKPLGEALAALDLISLRAVAGSSLEDAIICCQEQHPESILRQACVRALLKVDEQRGVQLGRSVLHEENTSTEQKLLVARHLAAEAHDASGYDVLKKGLISTDVYERKLAISLFEHFRALNGKVVHGETETKVDLREMLEDLQTKTNVQEIKVELNELAASLRDEE